MGVDCGIVGLIDCSIVMHGLIVILLVGNDEHEKELLIELMIIWNSGSACTL